ncbi:hypothetical protein PLICRDRAFT_36406 [Plicaturopsis crispa FD-325 SS-3]|nr:hypothetical protein PLICRDRAFT_36406 [Plicaturopsis crispa FD-325 SS-3]
MDEDDAPLVGDASQAPAAADGTDLAAPNITAEQPDEPSKPSSPKAQPLSLQPASQPPSERPSDTLDASLKPIDGSIDAVVDSGEKLDPEDVNGLNMSMLGPDGTAFEAAHDLSQIEGQEDALMGGPMMDQSSDPFEGTK